MTAPELTLNKVAETATAKSQEFRASDFLTNDEIDEIHTSNAKGRTQSRYDIIDAYVAEIIARFGYGTYQAWKSGEIDEYTMSRFIEAERDRERIDRLKLENLIVACVSGANHPGKGGHIPKTLKAAFKMLKSEEKHINRRVK